MEAWRKVIQLTALPISDFGFDLSKQHFWDAIRLMHFFFLKLGFTPCKAEQPLQGMELQEKKTQKD